MFCKKGTPKNFAKFTRKQQCWDLLLKGSAARCFPVHFAKSLKALIFKNICG